MRDAKRDLLRLKNLKQSKSYTSNIDFKWLVNTIFSRRADKTNDD